MSSGRLPAAAISPMGSAPWVRSGITNTSPASSWARCGARSRSLGSMYVRYVSGCSVMCESAEIIAWAMAPPIRFLPWDDGHGRRSWKPPSAWLSRLAAVGCMDRAEARVGVLAPIIRCIRGAFDRLLVPLYEPPAGRSVVGGVDEGPVSERDVRHAGLVALLIRLSSVAPAPRDAGRRPRQSHPAEAMSGLLDNVETGHGQRTRPRDDS